MAVEARRPNLPIPTDSSTTGGSVTDVATDLSRRTDKTSYSVPDDGSPLVIPTRRRNRDRDRGDDSKLSRGPQHSQTSLLIEYFEGGKGGSGSLVSRPSVRVRVTPSSKKLKDQRDHQIQVTESNGGQKPVFSRRISLNSPYRSQKGVDDDQPEVQNFDLEDDDSPRQPQNNPPFEIEFLNNRDQHDGSDLNHDQDNHYIPATSDISSMPADSLLEAPSSATNRRGSHSRERELEPESNENSNSNNDLLKTPAHKRSRSLSTERIAHKVAEKLSNDPQERKRLEKTVEEDVNKHLHDPDPESRSTRRRARKIIDDEMATPDSSLLGTSAVSGNQFSVRSGASNNKSSINNPRLLETVEDAIRRLILPELKELKKDQKVIHNTSKFERDLNTSSASGPSRDELGRRLSKHASAPDVMKPKVVLNKNSQDEGTTLLKGGKSSSTNRPALSKDRNLSKDSGLNSASEADSSHVKWGSRPDLTDQDMVRRQKSKGLRDAQKAGRVGTALTAAALQRHESKSTLDHSESQAHSDSQSQNERGAPGINETELIFQRHNVAPMPLRSMLDSELTRDSLTSQQTATGPDSGSVIKNRLQQRDAPSPVSRTPNRTPLDTRYELGVRPGDQSNQNLSVHSASDRNRSFSPMVEDYDFDDDGLHSNGGDSAAAGDIAAAAVANLLDEHSDPSRRRVLSPIQSVASEHSDLKDHKQHSSPRQSAGQEGKLGFSRGERALEPRLSIGSLSSAPSTNYARSAKPSGLSLNSQRNGDSQQSRGYGYGDSSRTDWDDNSNLGGPKHDDSEIDYMEKVHQGQRVSDGGGNNPQFVHPVPVESAVASLLDPSTVGPRSTQLGGKRSEPNMSRSLQPQVEEEEEGSPLKQRQDASSPDATSFLKRMGVTSPPQSVTQSVEDQGDLSHARSFDLGDDAMPQADNSPGSGSESEINTNPSIIQGPGLPDEEHQGYWNYDQATPEKQDQSGLEDSSPANRDLGLDDEMSYEAGQYPEGAFAHEDYLDQKYGDDTPSGGKDEGYASGAHPVSPSPGTPKASGTRDLDLDGDIGMFDSPGDGEDPFTPSHQRNLSGYSHGAGSPLYDSATGKGVERIQSKDIIALMDHLTVRDAQRNARDTEILVSLVRSAAEMRTSFEEMKKFIANQDGMMMEANDKHHERTYRALGGPRPQPPSNRPRQVAFADEEDAKTKRQNVFKRALKGLSLKSGNDLTKIEDMLEQLLDEVEALRDQQDEHFGTSSRPSLDQDYERDGEPANRPQPISRPSTVPEVDEEENEESSAEKEFLSPQLPSEENPGAAPVASGALDDMTPPRSNEKSRKPKGPASFFPKISRWSKATGDNIRNSIQPKNKDRFAFPYDAAASRSGDLPSGPYDYSPQGEDRIRSRVSFDDQQQGQEQQEEEGERPPSPLVPSQMSEAPKYHAHRNSLNLQHPQPRQGPTPRYQTQLESQAQDYGYPNSPQADQWGSTSSVHMAQKRNSVASRMSPISDAGYSQATSRNTGPPRPPKVRDEGPLIPERPPKVRDDDERSYTTNRHASRSSAMYASTSPQNSPPVRKLTGPRPLNSGSQYSSRRRRASPEQVDDLDY